MSVCVYTHFYNCCVCVSGGYSLRISRIETCGVFVNAVTVGDLVNEYGPFSRNNILSNVRSLFYLTNIARHFMLLTCGINVAHSSDRLPVQRNSG